MITYDRINSYFNDQTELPDGSVFSPAGFVALSEWSERQPWWPVFASIYSLDADWRLTAMGDSHAFSINLFAFLNDRSRWPPSSIRESQRPQLGHLDRAE